jgi:hypothetical protein
MGSLRDRLVLADDSVAEGMRRRRWAQLLRTFPALETMRVLDLGGTALFWTRAPVRPRRVTVINLKEPGDPVLPWLSTVLGDACAAEDLFGRDEFDLVISNSLIEHLRGHIARRRFARVAHAMAPRYVVQTPYRYFPVEPHWLFPGMQFLPLGARHWLAPRWPLGHTYRWDDGEALQEVLFTELLTLREMRYLFPDARIVWERIGGVPKSMTAIKGGAASTE